MKGYNDSNIFKKIQIILGIIFHRNSIICHDHKRKAEKNKVNLNYWRIDSQNKKDNLGDYLSLVVYEHLLKINNISKDKKLSKTKHIYGIGSVLLTGFQDCTVWGSGILGELKGLSGKITMLFNKFVRKLDIRAVRGPLTREYLIKNGIDCPKIYGDPAVLMPLIYQSKVKKQKNYLIINHYSQKQKKDENSVDLKTRDYKKVIDKICESELVISGSLHGIILAEAYGVPAILLEDRKSFSDFKYKDYYYSTGRNEFPIAKSIEEALSMTPPKLPELSKMQKDLLEVFPRDLWEK